MFECVCIRNKQAEGHLYFHWPPIVKTGNVQMHESPLPKLGGHLLPYCLFGWFGCLGRPQPSNNSSINVP